MSAVYCGKMNDINNSHSSQYFLNDTFKTLHCGYSVYESVCTYVHCVPNDLQPHYVGTIYCYTSNEERANYNTVKVNRYIVGRDEVEKKNDNAICCNICFFHHISTLVLFFCQSASNQTLFCELMFM